jgi:hypothetical protein
MNPDAAYIELADAKKAVRASRRAFARGPLTPFVKAMQAAMDTYRANRKTAMLPDDAVAALEVTLRASWPKAVSKFGFTCQSCEDTGTVEHYCWHEQRCGRETCAKHPERQHGYVTACHCDKGRRFQPKYRGPEDAIAAAGKTRKKVGSWRQVGS